MHPRRKGDGLSAPNRAALIAQAAECVFGMRKAALARDQQLCLASRWLMVLRTPASPQLVMRRGHRTSVTPAAARRKMDGVIVLSA